MAGVQQSIYHHSMRVGVYVDGYNLYYGMRRDFGRSTPGWRWLNVRALVEASLQDQVKFAEQQGWYEQADTWRDAQIERIVYCTARIDGASNPGGQRDQDIYLKALVSSQAVDRIEYGNYVSRVKQAPLAVPSGRRRRPEIVTSTWPVMIQDSAGSPIPDAKFIVSYQHDEEKGSDVNVASHMLIDALTSVVDAVVVVSNDSDLKLPVHHVRGLMPVGLLYPSEKVAGALALPPADRSGQSWARKVRRESVEQNQLPATIGNLSKPCGW